MSHMFEAKRREYTQGGLRRPDLSASPFDQFDRWFEQVEAAGLADPTAMVLASVGEAGQPSQRIVLLKHLDERGFVFYTNRDSRKGRELAANSRASLLFPWNALDRQVKVCGTVEMVDREQAERYFLSRPRQSQLAAWASRQSQVIPSRRALMNEYRRLEEAYRDAPVPVPDAWAGYRVVPSEIEFWQGGAYRLHDCFRYTERAGDWVIERVAP